MNIKKDPQEPNQTIIITGVAGFLGTHLAEYYLNKNDHIIGLDNLITGQQANIDFLKKKYPLNFHFFQKDICEIWSDNEFGSLQNSSFTVKTIYHFASAASVPHYQKYSLETMDANSVGLKNCLNFAKKYNSKVVFASTSEVYGDPLLSPQKEDYLGNVNTSGPRSCYDESKRFGEAMIYSWNQKYKTQHGVIRIFNTYGPRMSLDDGRVIIRFLQQALKNQPLTIYGHGQHTRSFCYVSDLINGIDLYANSNEITPMNLGRSDQITINALAKLIIELTESKSKVEYAELPLDDPQHRLPDLSFAKKKLNFEAKTDLKTGLSLMISWYKPKDEHEK